MTLNNFLLFYVPQLPHLRMIGLYQRNLRALESYHMILHVHAQSEERGSTQLVNQAGEGGEMNLNKETKPNNKQQLKRE